MHDEALEFKEPYTAWFERMRKARDSMLFDEDGEQYFLRLGSVSSFEMKPSNSSLLLQASDLLASGLFRYARLALNGEKIPPWLVDSLSVVLFGAAAPAYGGPDPFLSSLLGPVGRHLSEQVQTKAGDT